MKIGVLSDTHGYLDPQVPEIFRGVEHILHAGDIGLPWLILQLQELAPVTAVLGNADAGLEFKETEIIQLDGRKFVLHHSLGLPDPSDKLKRKIIRENPDVVVFGHTHQRHCEKIGETLYFNPGYAGKQRFRLPRSVAILHNAPDEITAEYFEI